MRLLEIGVHPEGIGIDDRNDVPPHGGIVAVLRQEVGDPPIHRRTDLGALEIDLRLIAPGDSLLILRVGRDGVRAVGLLLLHGDRHSAQLEPALRLPLRILGRGLSLLNGRIGEIESDPVVGRVDDQQQIALVHELIVGHRQLDDASRHLRRHGDHIGAHRAVARPRRPHIRVPHRPAEHCGERGCGERNQQRKNPEPCSLHVTSWRLGGADDTKIGRLATRLRFGFGIGHGDQPAMTSTIDDSTITYTAKMNSAGCQTFRSNP